MRALLLAIVLAVWAGSLPSAAAATGRIKKVLPHFLDKQGKHTISPSLYDRDAYQNQLRLRPEKRGGMQFDINWKTKGSSFGTLKLRIELRGVVEGSLPKRAVLEKTIAGGGGLFGHWTSLTLTEKEYKEIGEVTAWRASIWEGKELLAERTSFLW